MEGWGEGLESCPGSKAGLGAGPAATEELTRHLSKQETMGFFLILVLLGGIVCNFFGVHSEQLSGIGNGFFSTGEEKPGGKIQAVQFFVGLFGEFKGVQIKINSKWSEKYGLSSGNPEKFTLWEGESIIKVSGYHNLCIYSITMETNFGRAFTFGEPVANPGQRFTASPPQEGMALSGIKGLYDIICIKKLAFDWKFIPEITHPQIK